MPYLTRPTVPRRPPLIEVSWRRTSNKTNDRAAAPIKSLESSPFTSAPTPPAPPPPPPSHASSSDQPVKKPDQGLSGRSNLLDEIRSRGGFAGAGLQRVDDNVKDTFAANNNNNDKGGMMHALHQALNIIQKANRASDDEDGDDEDGDVDSDGSWSEED